MIGSRSDNQYKQSFSSVSSPLLLMSWGHTLHLQMSWSSAAVWWWPQVGLGLVWFPNPLATGSFQSLMMTSGGAWISSNCTGAVPRHRLLHNLNMQSRHLHLCPQLLFVKHTVDRRCAQCLLMRLYEIDAMKNIRKDDQWQLVWRGVISLPHLLASNGTGAGHMFVATLCVLHKKQSAKAANCKSSKAQKQLTAKVANCKSSKLQK